MDSTPESGGEAIDVSTVDEPPGMERVRAVAQLLDEAIELPVVNYRIGLDPILGILPAGGDAVSAAISLYIVAEGVRMEASPETVLRMVANVAIDAVIGSVPVLGTIFDAVFKANRRNVALLEAEFEATQ